MNSYEFVRTYYDEEETKLDDKDNDYPSDEDDALLDQALQDLLQKSSDESNVVLKNEDIQEEIINKDDEKNIEN